MLRLTTRPAVIALAALLLAQGRPALAQNKDWGTIKGQVIWGEDKVPTPGNANVDKDKEHCLSKGPIPLGDLIINAKNKGVKNVLVYLQDLKDAKNDNFLPEIHPSYKNFKKSVSIDQPCCAFEPRLIVLREGQNLIVKNSAPIPHNFKIDSPLNKGPTLNQLIPAGKEIEVTKFVSRAIPTMYGCSVHTWMKGYVAIFKHPYYAITDADGKFEIKNAPAGKYRLVFWHEKVGWVILNPKNLADRGRTVTIKKDEVVTTADVKMKLPKE